MNTIFEQIWRKLAASKRYREQFVAAQAKRAIPFQLRALMKKKGLSQEKLADQSKLTQGVISRAADPNYGNLTINTIVKIANGLDVAYLGIFVPFSELAKWFSNFSEDSVQVMSFEEEIRSTNTPIALPHGAAKLGPLKLQDLPKTKMGGLQGLGPVSHQGASAMNALDIGTTGPIQ